MKRKATIIVLAAIAFFMSAPDAARAATFTVDTLADTNGLNACTAAPNDCTFRGAVFRANNTAGDDIIDVQIGTYTLSTANSASLDVTTVITINGAGALSTIIERDIAGGGNGTIFNVTSTGNLTLNNMTVRRGNSFGVAGGFINTGALIVNNCWITENQASNSGGGFHNTGTLQINNSTVSGNSAGNAGGGVYTTGSGTTRISGATFSGNTSAGHGGGAFAGTTNTAVLEVTNSTFSGNNAGANGGGIGSFEGTVRLRNTLLVGNTATSLPNYFATAGAMTFTGGSNLFSTTQTGTWDGSDLLNNSNSRLSPLGYYGGPGMSYIPLTGSSAIDAGQDCALNMTCGTFNSPIGLSTDERGLSRSGIIDIGAVEGGNVSPVAGLPAARQNLAYSFNIIAESGAFSVSMPSGALPNGMSISGLALPPRPAKTAGASLSPQAAIVLAGTPTVQGTFNFTLSGTNGVNTFTQDYQLIVAGPTAAAVSVAGRVSAGNGAGVKGALVIITDSSGNTRTALTNQFGYYRFDDVSAGAAYIVSVTAKNREFAPQIVTATADVEDLNFSAAQ